MSDIIQIAYGGMQIALENEVMKAICNVGIDVNKEELLKALELSESLVTCAECAYLNVQNTKYLYAICERHGIEFKPFEDDTRTHFCAWGIKADRKTEPNCSEKPNNCETCKHWWRSEDVCLLDDCQYEPQTEPQTDYRITGTIGYRCPKCGRGNFLNNESNCVYCGTLLIKTEPQTEVTTDCSQMESSTNEGKVQLTDCAWK